MKALMRGLKIWLMRLYLLGRMCFPGENLRQWSWLRQLRALCPGYWEAKNHYTKSRLQAEVRKNIRTIHGQKCSLPKKASNGRCRRFYCQGITKKYKSGGKGR